MDSVYQLRALKKFDELPINGEWFNFKSKNVNAEALMEIVKIRINLSGDFEISNDYKMFRKIKLFDSTAKNNEITYSIDFREDTGELTEKEQKLEAKPQAYDKKKFSAALGRAS